MKKNLLLSVLLISTTAMAFGGGGSGRKATYEPGLVAIGAHFGGNGGSVSECTPDCGVGQECVGGACITVTPAALNGCSNNGDCTTSCPLGKTCYCAISSILNYNDSNCYTDFTGTCAEVATKSDITGGYTASSDRMTWWSAVNFCKATGTSLVSLSTVGITGGYASTGMCSTTKCAGVDWSDLQDKLGDSAYWTKDAVSCEDTEFYSGCTTGNNNNSCYAFLFATHSFSPYVHGNERSYTNDVFSHALCK